MTLHYQGNPWRGGGQKMKQDMGISLCDKHMHKKRLSLVVVPFALPFFIPEKVVYRKVKEIYMPNSIFLLACKMGLYILLFRY